MPASSAVRRSLISDLPVIYVIMRRHNLKISLVLRSCMRAGIGSGGKIVCIVYHNTLRMIFRPCILVATLASVNPHLLCSSFLSTSILDRRTSGIFTPISPAFSKIETASFKINPMQTASRR